VPPSDRAASSGRPRFGRGFHTLFGASLIAALGTGMHAAALPLLVVHLTDDPVQLGLVVLFASCRGRWSRCTRVRWWTGSTAAG
jgi:hypothetical protein